VLTLPAALALAVAGQPIMEVLFGRGAFDEHSALLGAQSLAAYAFGLPAFVLLKVLVPAFFAHGETGTPVRVGMVAIGINLCLNLLFMVPLQHVGPALATSLSALFNVVTLAVLLSRKGRLALDRRLRRRLPRMAAAALAMAAALIYTQSWLAPLFGTHWRYAALGMLVGSGVAAYGLAAQVLGAFDVRELGGMLRRRRAGRGSA
jgi:putative peptidoglycan lipid II flippase